MPVEGAWKADGDMLLRWSLGFEDLALLETKPLSARLGFAAQLLIYRATGHFARGTREIPDTVVAYLADQTGVRVPDLADYDWVNRSGRRHREIFGYLGIRRASRQDLHEASSWLGIELCPLGLSAADMTERLLAWFAERRVAAPEQDALASMVGSARRTFEDKVLAAIASALSAEHRRQLDASLDDDDSVTGFAGLKADSGQPNLDNIMLAAQRLAFVKQLALPTAALPDLGDPIARLFRRRVANETAWTMRRHPAGRRHALYALYLAHRQRELTDGLVDLLVEVVHKVGNNAGSGW